MYEVKLRKYTINWLRVLHFTLSLALCGIAAAIWGLCSFITWGTVGFALWVWAEDRRMWGSEPVIYL